MDIMEVCAALNREGRSYVLITVTNAEGSSPARPGFRMVVTVEDIQGTVGGGDLEKSLADEAREILSGKKELLKAELRDIELRDTGMSCGGRVTVFIEYFNGTIPFVVFGGGHVGRALVPILELLGFSVTVFDDRPEVRDLIETPQIKTIISGYQNISGAVPFLKAGAYCFIATHGHEFDYMVLKQILLHGKNLKYIGMIGSKNKVRIILKKIADEGISIPDSLHSPVGLKIGGDTAAEIAVSIAAEVVAVKNNTPVQKMRLEVSELGR